MAERTVRKRNASKVGGARAGAGKPKKPETIIREKTVKELSQILSNASKKAVKVLEQIMMDKKESGKTRVAAAEIILKKVIADKKSFQEDEASPLDPFSTEMEYLD